MFHYKKDFLQISEFEHSDGREAETTSRKVEQASRWVQRTLRIIVLKGPATKY